jgi:putative endonuclease
MFYTYILKSQKNGAYYVDYTSNIKARLGQHNSDAVPSTKNIGPWEIFYFEKSDTEAAAIRRERQIKSWKSRKAIERLKFCDKIEDPRF